LQIEIDVKRCIAFDFSDLAGVVGVAQDRVQIQPQGQKRQWLQIGWQHWPVSTWTDAALHKIRSGQHHGRCSTQSVIRIVAADLNVGERDGP